MKRTRKKRSAPQQAVPGGTTTNTPVLIPEDSDSPLIFPCSISVKVMGKADAAFTETLMRITAAHYPDLPETAITKRESSGGKFWSYSIRVEAQSRAEIDNFFRALTADEHILMVI